MTERHATLSIDGNDLIELPISSGTEGQDVIDISKLGSTGHFTFDPGFMATASCESEITYIDGAKGILLHRGYPIDQLASNADYLEVCYILLHGDKPSQAEYNEFVALIKNHTMVHDQLMQFFKGFRRRCSPNGYPLWCCWCIVFVLPRFDLDVNNPRHRDISAIRLIAKMPTLAAMSYKYSIGQPFVYPKNELSYSENFLNMMFSVPAEDYKISPTIARAMDRIFTASR